MRKLPFSFLVFCVAIVAILAVPLFALAQVVPPDPSDPGVFLKAILDAVAGKDWYVTTGLGVIGVVWALRKYLAPKVAFFASDVGGIILNFVVTFGTGLGATLAAHQPVTLPLLGKLLGGAFALGGGWSMARKLLRFVAPLVAKIPGVGGFLSTIFVWLSGGDIPAAVAKATDAAYKPISGPTGAGTAAGLDQPPKP